MSRSTDGPGTEERVFAALPPARGRGFAVTWWGRAWLKALEESALDGEQLRLGRARARAGAVGAVVVRPGRITAVVRDRDGTAHRADVVWRELPDEAWERFLGLAADRAGHVAALLEREVPPHLVEDAAAVGADLLPGIGDLEPSCSCEAWDHCPHTAALSYQMARLLDEDPFTLLLMRGRGERRLLGALRERSAARAESRDRGVAAGDGGPEGVRADEAFAVRTTLPELPEPSALPDAPGEPPALGTGAAPPPGVDPAVLEALAADAAARAHRLLADALAPGHVDRAPQTPPEPVRDAVRLAAAAEQVPGAWARLAAGSGRRPAELARAVRAWRLGGEPALAVLEGRDGPGPEALARAADRLAGAWEPDERPPLRAAGPGRWTIPGAGAQLRVDREGRWWPYAREAGDWVPAGPPDRDPAAALAAVTTGRADG
ncbi:SWF or SNF family helicase [Streptomyces sp. LP05-1]|uniref:SWF or SNF family helicase n=1 Tax=Streptomyces pyxinae TaxID=2970734 RepID=A0ABT2CBV0_9ACTN|nr:SWF or SNF family helicase [Streptomyces sp. LP05-1]MCS0634887.1 SWF or SNF family helicase [Streptomyces sp. LP05-1]